MKQLSKKQAAGQRIMAGFDGTAFNDDLAFLIDELKVGGLILFSRNLETPQQIKTLCADCQAYAKKLKQPPLLISIDQEGGQVARLKAPFFTRFAGNPFMKKPDEAAAFADITAKELAGIGVNMNMAPVLDIAHKEVDSIMKGRSFGSDPQFVAEMGSVMIDAFQSDGIMAVAKHFPGIGKTVLDSHLDLPDLDADINDLEKSDFIPFEAAIKHQVAGMMLSHIRYTTIDPNWPASMSLAIVKGILRDKMGYGGVVMTDDLDMGAIKKHHGIDAVIQQVLESDVDIALICHKGPDIEDAFHIILDLCQKNPALGKMCETSVKRILDLKKKYLGF